MPSREKVFSQFLKEVGVKRFGPEFVDSLVAVMRDTVSSSLTEQLFAWTRWRGWCNSSKWAVSDWNPETPGWRYLDQIDAALDLAWFQEGRPLEWVEGVPEDYRQRARKDGAPERPLNVLAPDLISRGFTKNVERGTISFDGRKIEPVVIPLPPKNTRKLAVRTTFEQDFAFLEWWKVGGLHNFQVWENARTAYFEARKLGRTAHRAYLDRPTSGVPILIDIKTLSNDGNIHNPPPPPEPLSQVVAKADDEDGKIEVQERVSQEPVLQPYDQFKANYPQNRFDEAKTRKAFSKLSKEEHLRVNQRLLLYLQSERWKRSIADDAGRFIPFASNFLNVYNADPPSYMPPPGKAMVATATGEPAKESYIQRKLREAAERRREFEEMTRRAKPCPQT